MSSKAIYAGSFDPISVGHIGVIVKAARHFALTIAIGNNPKKRHWLSIETRRLLVEQTLRDMDLSDVVNVVEIQGLLSDKAKELDIGVVIRGLRNTVDFEYEFGMAQINRDIGSLDTYFVPAEGVGRHISSTAVRELYKLGGNIQMYVPRPVYKALTEGTVMEDGRITSLEPPWGFFGGPQWPKEKD